MRLIKLILKITKPQAIRLGAFWFLGWKNFEFQKISGCGDHTRINRPTRQSAQFSSGKATLIRSEKLASDFWNFLRQIRRANSFTSAQFHLNNWKC
jgi:hypothetical protein